MQSFTASRIQSSIGLITPHLTSHTLPSRTRAALGSRATSGYGATFAGHRSRSLPNAVGSEGLLHDARNLVGTIGLYCDLLSMPGVLKPEHRQYPEELRILGARSKSLIDHLMQSLFALEDRAASNAGPEANGADSLLSGGRKQIKTGGGDRGPVSPVSLKTVIERCSGLLRRVASGRLVEITYGPAAAVRVRVAEEVVERILVNLVRNAATAMGTKSSAGDQPMLEGRTNAPVAIRILVGPLVSSVGEHKPWPFQRVRLVVEDAGKGMNPQQLEQLLGGTGARSRGGHGIGFGVVRDLVAASEGEIRVMSEPEIGTRVQIEWPMVAMPEAGNRMDETEVAH